MKKINVLIVDDERLARKELISLLGSFENICVAGEADSVETAIKIIESKEVNVIFLDIQMPGKSGFTLLEKIKPDINIVFVTAYDEYALRAFEVNALDYLLKPVNPARLAKTIIKLSVTGKSKGQPSQKFELNDTIFLLINSQMKFLKINSIISITSSGDYTSITTTDGIKGLTSKSMREWELRLPENTFIRIHRNAIVNTDYIEKVDEWFNHAYQVYLKDSKDPLTMSRRCASKIKQKNR
jgi:two-component system, LytTR family, response regulator